MKKPALVNKMISTRVPYEEIQRKIFGVIDQNVVSGVDLLFVSCLAYCYCQYALLLLLVLLLISSCVSFFYSFLCEFSPILRYSSVGEFHCKTDNKKIKTTTTMYCANTEKSTWYWSACICMLHQAHISL